MLSFVALSPTHRFMVKDYHRMVEAEVFAPDARVELIDGRAEVALLRPRADHYANGRPGTWCSRSPLSAADLG